MLNHVPGSHSCVPHICFPRASEQRVDLKVVRYYTLSHAHIFTSSRLCIFSLSHLYILSLSHLYIFIFAHVHICSCSIFTFSQPILSFSHCHIFSTSCRLILTPSYMHTTHSHFHMLSSTHLHTFSLSLSLSSFLSLSLLPSCPLWRSLPFFVLFFKSRGRCRQYFGQISCLHEIKQRRVCVKVSVCKNYVWNILCVYNKVCV